jgi:hypothetical protein
VSGVLLVLLALLTIMNHSVRRFASSQWQFFGKGSRLFTFGGDFGGMEMCG